MFAEMKMESREGESRKSSTTVDNLAIISILWRIQVYKLLVIYRVIFSIYSGAGKSFRAVSLRETTGRKILIETVLQRAVSLE